MTANLKDQRPKQNWSLYPTMKCQREKERGKERERDKVCMHGCVPGWVCVSERERKRESPTFRSKGFATSFFSNIHLLFPKSCQWQKQNVVALDIFNRFPSLFKLPWPGGLTCRFNDSVNIWDSILHMLRRICPITRVLISTTTKCNIYISPKPLCIEINSDADRAYLYKICEIVIRNFINIICQSKTR